MKNSINALIGAVFAGVVSLGALAPAAADEVTLRAVTFLPTSAGTLGAHMKEFARRLNEAGKGVIQVDIIGGPEAIAADQQANAVRSGVVDMMFASAGNYQSFLPLTDYYTVTRLDPIARRELGISEMLNELFAKRMNTRVLADFLYSVENVLYLGDVSDAQVAAIKDGNMKGLRFRGTASYRPVLDEFGIETYPIAPADVFTALERGTIDGFGWVSIDMLVQGWGDVTKYRISPTFNHGQSNLQINLRKWNSLTDEQREILDRVAREWEVWSLEDGKKRNEEEAAAQLAAGIEAIQLSNEASAHLMQVANVSTWKNFERILPDTAATLRAFEPKE